MSKLQQIHCRMLYGCLCLWIILNKQKRHESIVLPLRGSKTRTWIRCATWPQMWCGHQAVSLRSVCGWSITWISWLHLKISTVLTGIMTFTTQVGCCISDVCVTLYFVVRRGIGESSGTVVLCCAGKWSTVHVAKRYLPL